MEIWTEKYRPKKITEIVGQLDVIAQLEGLIKSKNLPHLLFSGPAGVGKTTTALAIARELFGDSWRDSILELNASDQRGIDTIRIQVKDFARTKAIQDVPFKLIYLDEADALTKEAQQALRRIMEDYSNTTRFILSCNYVSKIISPIQSRCAVFRFKVLDIKELEEILKKILKQENITIEEDAKQRLIELCEGDARRLENLLQSAASLTKKIDLKTIERLSGILESKEIENMLEFAFKGKLSEAKQILENLRFRQGLSGMDILKAVSQELFRLKLDDEKKFKAISLCAECEFRIVEGSNELIQLMGFLAGLSILK